MCTAWWFSNLQDTTLAYQEAIRLLEEEKGDKTLVGKRVTVIFLFIIYFYKFLETASILF
jgi:hypothetical protein